MIAGVALFLRLVTKTVSEVCLFYQPNLRFVSYTSTQCADETVFSVLNDGSERRDFDFSVFLKL